MLSNTVKQHLVLILELTLARLNPYEDLSLSIGLLSRNTHP
jgi:hypothetical protein